MSLSAYAIYCEDIREEVDNQFSLIGCFKGHVKVESFPVVVPKIAINLTWVQSLDEKRAPVEAKVLYRHLDDDSTIQLGEVTFDIGAAKINAGGELIHAAASMRMSLTLARAGVLGVRIYRLGEEMRLQGLSFVEADQSPTATS